MRINLAEEQPCTGNECSCVVWRRLLSFETYLEPNEREGAVNIVPVAVITEPFSETIKLNVGEACE